MTLVKVKRGLRPAAAGGGGGASFTPFYLGKFNVGTIGAIATTEYVTQSAFSNANPIIYSNDVTGPFGETKVGKVQLLAGQTPANGYYYGAFIKTPTPIASTVGAEMWARAYLRFPTNWCNGGIGTSGGYPEAVNGAIKFFRLFFDSSNRLTLLLGRQDNGSGQFLEGSCASISVSPVLGMANSEIGSTNHYATTFPVLSRDTWYALQWYVKFGTGGTANGIFRAWVNDTRVINATNVVTRPSGSFDTVANGFAMPGDYWNGGPGANNPFYVANMIMATGASPPTDLDTSGTAYIPYTLDATTL